MEAFGAQPYLFEPEYTEEELRQFEQSRPRPNVSVESGTGSNNTVTRQRSPPASTTTRYSNTNNSNNVDTDTDRSTDENRGSFCLCGMCQGMPTEKENVCCRGFLAQASQQECVTHTEDFSLVCLQEPVLKVAFAQFLQYKKRDPTAASALTNRQRRLMSYRQLALWLSLGRTMGKGNRMVLPSCCVTRIRERFPSEDYIGFREVDEALNLEL